MNKAYCYQQRHAQVYFTLAIEKVKLKIITEDNTQTHTCIRTHTHYDQQVKVNHVGDNFHIKQGSVLASLKACSCLGSFWTIPGPVPRITNYYYMDTQYDIIQHCPLKLYMLLTQQVDTSHFTNSTPASINILFSVCSHRGDDIRQKQKTKTYNYYLC